MTGLDKKQLLNKLTIYSNGIRLDFDEVEYLAHLLSDDIRLTDMAEQLSNMPPSS